jgi:hypothetical protein
MENSLLFGASHNKNLKAITIKTDLEVMDSLKFF